MSTCVSFRPNDDTEVTSLADLRQRLADALEIDSSNMPHDEESRFILGGTDIIISLTLDESGNPIKATADFPRLGDTSHVVRLFKSFRSMGWDS